MHNARKIWLSVIIETLSLFKIQLGQKAILEKAVFF
jgi:hypothetical protein